MNVLYYAAKMGLKITTLQIDAIYIENNASSHFNPIVDTLKIYRSLFSLARGTFISFAFAELLVFLATFIGNHDIFFIIPSVGALSLALCIILNKYVFFKKASGQSHLTTMAYTLISYFVYTPICMVMAFLIPNIPLALNFNLVFFLCLPLKFFLHQLIFIASITKE